MRRRSQALSMSSAITMTITIPRDLRILKETS
jgi:hypothetical protein